MTHQPYISIIMPAFGVEKYIAKAIESVIAQSYEDWELIVVNDGTKDKSADIATTYALKDKRITVLHKQNGGLSDARNFGMLHAKGTYIHFFDSDDWIEPDWYEKMALHAQKSDADIIIGGYTIDYEDERGHVEKSIKKTCHEGNNINISKASDFDFVETYLNYAWNKLFRIAFLKTNQLVYEKGLYVVEDSEMMSRAVACHPKLQFISLSGYHYINRERTTQGRSFNDNVIGYAARKISINQLYLDHFCQDDQLKEQILSETIMQHYLFLFHLLYSCSKGMTRKETISAIKKIINDPQISHLAHRANENTLLRKLLKRFIISKNVILIDLFYRMRNQVSSIMH